MILCQSMDYLLLFLFSTLLINYLKFHDPVSPYFISIHHKRLCIMHNNELVVQCKKLRGGTKHVNEVKRRGGGSGNMISHAKDNNLKLSFSVTSYLQKEQLK